MIHVHTLTFMQNTPIDNLKLTEAENDDNIKLCFSIDEGASLLNETCYHKAVCSLTLSDRPAIMSALLNYHLMIKVKAKMEKASRLWAFLKFCNQIFPCKMKFSWTRMCPSLQVHQIAYMMVCTLDLYTHYDRANEKVCSR